MQFKLLISKKTLLKLKLTTLFLIAFGLHLSARTHSQDVTISVKNAPFETVLNLIKTQTGFSFFADGDLLSSARPVNLNLKKVSLTDALKIVFKDQLFTYSIDGKIITIITPTPDLNRGLGGSFSSRFLPPPITVRGRIINEKGEPVIASVIVKGTNKGTTTDADGNFEISNVDDNAILIVSGVTIESKEVKIKGQSSIVISTATKINAEDEVVINGGYYKTTNRTKTGSIEKVSSKDIERQPVTSPLLALQGRMAGVDVSPSSGVPGGNVKIEIRGKSSFRFDGAYPLYVIDGVPVDATPVPSAGYLVIDDYDPLSSISPSNIESIEVLKDADATSIYGSRGANGVVLITTKHAHKSGTTADFNIYRGIGQLTKKLDMLNTPEYLAMRREAFKNNNNQAMTEFNAEDFLVWDTSMNTDWQDVFFGGTSDIADIQAGVSGGNANTSFRFSAGYHNETTIFPGDYYFRRFTGNFSLDHVSLDNRFKATISANYGVSQNQFFNANAPVTDALNMPPNAPKLFNEDGTLNWEPNSFGDASWTNPLAVYKQTNDSKQSSLIFNGTLNYYVGAGLSIKTNLGFSALNSQEILKTPFSSFDPAYAPYISAESVFSDGFRRSWIVEPQLHFLRKFGIHGLNIIIGTTFQQGSTELKQINATGYTSDALLGSLQGASDTRVILDQTNEYLYTSLFARLGYNLKEKYLINLTGRRDGSSRFGANNRFGNFGAIGAGWIFSKENWVADYLRFISFGKLRASVGTSGNDQIGDYKYLNTYSITPYKYTGSIGLLPTSLFNPAYKWEINKKIEAAAEFAFLNNRISLEVAWYRNRSTNQLTEYQLPGTTGFGSILKNLDATIQNTGWEYSVNVQVINSENLRWTASANYSRPKNKLIKFDNIENSPYAEIYVVGESLSMERFYTFTGVDPATGVYTFIDVDGSGTINSSDRILIKDIGRSYFAGVNNALTYRGVEFSFLLQFVKQTSIPYKPASTPGKKFNVLRHIYDNRWVEEGDEANFQKVSTSNSLNAPFSNYSNSSDGGVENSSFLRLKTLSLSYALPSIIIEKFKIRQCLIYVQGQNLFTRTDYSGLDPETGSTAVPPLRMISLGIQLGL